MDASVKIGTLATALLWLIGAGLVLGDVFDVLPNETGHLGVLSTVAGLMVYCECKLRALAVRERVAFEIGKESFRAVK